MDPLLELDYHPRLPKKRDRGIGIVGAGAIVNVAHLPAYKKAGFTVAAITDLDYAKAEQTAHDFDIPTVHSSAEELIADPRVEIVDIAVYPQAQAEIAPKVAAAGKHFLCQKPLSEDFETAVRLVEAAERAGVRMAVNQQMRWDQAVRSTRSLMDRGWFGELAAGTIDSNIFTDWGMWPWIAAKDRLEYFYHSIHYLDSIRFLFGNPLTVLASMARYPGQFAVGETRTFTILEYSDTLQVHVVVNHNNWSERRHAIIRVEGTDGLAEGTLGLLYNYPHGRPDTLDFVSRSRYPGYTFSVNFEERWIPDAFVGPMADLQCAIEEDREPETSGRDNLDTLRVIHAAYRSAAEGRKVAPQEIVADLATLREGPR